MNIEVAGGGAPRPHCPPPGEAPLPCSSQTFEHVPHIYIYIYIYIYTYIYTHTYLITYIHTYICIYIYVYTYLCIGIHI